MKPSPSSIVGPVQTLTDPAPQPPATPTLTPPPLPLTATICLGQEPASLYPYSLSGTAARIISAALYPGFYEPQNLNNSTAGNPPGIVSGSTPLLEPISVLPGELIVDAYGELNVLAPDALYRPAGCINMDCAQVYSGNEPVQLDQWVLRFQLLPGLKWSDGEPLTASDSVYSYEVAKTLKTPRLVDVLEHTAAYRALDEQTVEWRGLPGYAAPDTANKFFAPLAQHVWEGPDPANLATAGLVSRQPVGYGPFMVASWIEADRITLVRNPNYYRAAENLPYLDELAFVFVPAGEAAEQALLAENSGCDILDASAIQETQIERYAALELENKVKLVAQPAAWEALYFNVAPLDPEQASIFSQVEVRQAAALCIDRAQIAQKVFGSLAVPAAGLDSAESAEFTYDPAQGQALLEQAGWRDLDQSPTTPRTAVGVPGVVEGTALSFVYLVSDEPDRQVAAQIASQGLTACGFGVEISYQPAAEYLRPGPEGPVFGRSFAAAQFAWSVPGGQVPCDLFISTAIPGPYPQSPQEWGGANLSGYASPAFDQSCITARTSLPGADQAAAWQLVNQIFTQDLPAVPLYWRPRLYVMQPDVCGLFAESEIKSSSLSLEYLNKGKVCQSRD